MDYSPATLISSHLWWHKQYGTARARSLIQKSHALYVD